MKTLTVVQMWKFLKLSKTQQRDYLRKNTENKEFMELIYIGVNTSIDFGFKLPEEAPRPVAPIDYHSTFFSLAMSSVRDRFNKDKS